MKKTDIAMIILIAAVSAALAYVLANSLFGDLDEKGAKVKTIDAIQSSIQQPSVEVFNENAINPAVEVNVESSAEEEMPVPEVVETEQTDDSLPDGGETPQGV